MADHVHMLISIPRSTRSLKWSASSKAECDPSVPGRTVKKSEILQVSISGTRLLYPLLVEMRKPFVITSETKKRRTNDLSNCLYFAELGTYWCLNYSEAALATRQAAWRLTLESPRLCRGMSYLNVNRACCRTLSPHSVMNGAGFKRAIMTGPRLGPDLRR